MATPQQTPHQYNAQPTPPITSEAVLLTGNNSVFDQVSEQGDLRNNHNLLGLSWLQEDGSTIEIIDRDVLHNTDVKSKDIHFLDFHKTIHKSKPAKTELWQAKVYNAAGELVSLRSYNEDQLIHVLDDQAQNLEWVTRESKPNEPTVNIGIAIDPDKSIFESVIESLEKEGLENMAGLTWKRDGMTVKVANEFMLTDRSKYGLHDLREADRAFVIKMYDDQGRVVSRATLVGKAFVNFLPKSDEGMQSLHWEVQAPNPNQQTNLNAQRRDLDTEAKLWFSNVAVNKNVVLEAEQHDLHTVDLETAKGMLINIGNLLQGDERELAEDKINKYAVTLRSMVVTYGLNSVIEFAAQLHAEYAKTLETLGLESDEHDDISWTIWELIQQSYSLMHHDTEKDDEKFIKVFGENYPVADPFEDSKASKLKRQEIIDRLVGRAFETKAVNIRTVQISRGKGNPKERRVQITENPIAPTIVRDNVELPYLEEVMKELKVKGQYSSPAKLAHLGRRLRRSVNHQPRSVVGLLNN